MKEADLFYPVKKYLLESMRCERVYAEVLNYDVVGVLGKYTVIVEMKKNLSFKVIEQAIHAKRHGNYVFIAVPKPKYSYINTVSEFLKYNGIGLILIDKLGREDFGGVQLSAQIQTGLFAKLNRNVADLFKYIEDGYHDTIVGGHKMGDFDYQSDYTRMIDNIKAFLRRHSNKWVSVDEILEHCQCYYANPKIQLTVTLKENWNADWIEHRKINRTTHFKYIDTTEQRSISD